MYQKSMLIHALRELQSRGVKPRVHGNGFIQIDMDSRVRVHVWGHNEIPCQETQTPIHDHAFSFTSTVIMGTMINMEFSTVDMDYRGDDGHYRIYEPRIRCDEDTVLERTQRTCNLELTNTEMFETGQSYRVLAKEIHMTVTPEPTVTVIEKDTKTQAQGGGTPRVFVAEGTTPDNEFERYQASAGTLWRIVWEVLGVVETVGKIEI